MHTTVNMERFFVTQAPKDVVDALHLVKLLFGARKSFGYVKYSLKPALNEMLNNRPERSVFYTDLGSR